MCKEKSPGNYCTMVRNGTTDLQLLGLEVLECFVVHGHIDRAMQAYSSKKNRVPVVD